MYSVNKFVRIRPVLQ